MYYESSNIQPSDIFVTSQKQTKLFLTKKDLKARDKDLRIIKTNKSKPIKLKNYKQVNQPQHEGVTLYTSKGRAWRQSPPAFHRFIRKLKCLA